MAKTKEEGTLQVNLFSQNILQMHANLFMHLSLIYFNFFILFYFIYSEWVEPLRHSLSSSTLLKNQGVIPYNYI